MATRPGGLAAAPSLRRARIASGGSAVRLVAPSVRVQWAVGTVSMGILAIWLLSTARHPQMDFDVYRLGGLHVLGSGLYGAHVTLLGRRLLFTYTPFAALLFWPISFLPTGAGQVIWDIANLIGVVALVALSLAVARGRTVRRDDWRHAVMLTGPIGLILFPVHYDLALGQINVFLVLMVLADLTMPISVGSRRLPRGVLVGLAAAIKLTPLVFIPYLLFTRQVRAAVTAAITFVLATGALFAVAPSASWLYFRKDAYSVQRVGNDLSLANQSLHAIIGRAGLSTTGAVTDLCLLVVLCAGIAVAVAASRRSSNLLGILVCGATGLLVSPISWWHHYIWLVPALAWMLLSPDRPKRGAWWAGFGILVFLFVPSATANGSGPLIYIWDNAYTLWALAFIALVGCMLLSRRRSQAEPTLAELTS
jgi:alpha-1,2-mannosyltransferase